jgi:hypothetical protein
MWALATSDRGVADSFSGGSPDLKKKTEKTEKKLKTLKKT